MSDGPLTPPADLSTGIVSSLNESSSDRLRDIASYAEALAEYKEREARLEEESDDVGERPDDLPDDVPATATIEESDDNRNYWR